MAKKAAPTPDLPEKRGRGRPTLYRPEYCDLVIEWGREGWSKAEMAAELAIDRDTLDNWAAANPEFFGALARAVSHSLAWWEKQGRQNLATHGFNAALYAKCMAGRFPREPYRNQIEVSGGLEIEERRTVDIRGLASEQREALRGLLIEAVQRLEEPEAIEGEFEARE